MTTRPHYFIDITISERAEISAVTREVKGDKCLEAIPLLESLIRAKIADSFLTKDYFEEVTNAQKNKGSIDSQA